MTEYTTYLLHFDKRYHHAGHYLGKSSQLDKRIAAHRAGRGGRLLEVIRAAHIGFRLARTWDGDHERELKRRHSGVRLCPICRGETSPITRRRRPMGDPRPIEFYR